MAELNEVFKNVLMEILSTFCFLSWKKDGGRPRSNFFGAKDDLLLSGCDSLRNFWSSVVVLGTIKFKDWQGSQKALSDNLQRIRIDVFFLKYTYVKLRLISTLQSLQILRPGLFAFPKRLVKCRNWIKYIPNKTEAPYKRTLLHAPANFYYYL